MSTQLLEAVALAIANKAAISVLVAVGHGKSCRDITVGLSVAESAKVYETVAQVLRARDKPVDVASFTNGIG